ncbi:RHS repeat domain-containing protein [Thermodesulfobacteriota bacterium]
MDNITAKASEHGDYQFTYDDLYRLMTADNPILNDEAFTYDQVGNRLTASGVTDEWSYNDNNELQGYDDVSYEYDENGSITQKTDNGVVTKFFYNVEGRLERVEDGSSNVLAEYYYDPFGRRLWKEVSGTTTFFQYADEGLVAEYDGTGTEIKAYGYKPGSTWNTDPLFMKQGTEYYFYHNDHLGTSQKMTAVNGAVVWGAQYEAFGKASVDGGSTVVNNLRFPGQYFDDETGLHFNWNRYYDPVSGRYFRVDPIGFEGGLNGFSYTSNNPASRVDPSGLIQVRWKFGPRDNVQFSSSRNTIEVLPGEIHSSDNCKFDHGPPDLHVYVTSRIFWHAELLKQPVPELKTYNSGKCCPLECYIYEVSYKWHQSVFIPELPWYLSFFDLRRWQQTDIYISICANGDVYEISRNTSSNPKEYVPEEKKPESIRI